MNHLTETQLNEHLDEMLDESTRLNAEMHLAICKQCSAQLNEMETLFSTLADLSDMPLTRDLRAGVLARLPRAPQIPALWRQPAFVMQSLLAILLLAMSMPMLGTLSQQVAEWERKIALPTMHFPTLAKIATQLTPLLIWKFHFSFTLPELLLTMPTLPALPFSLDVNTVLLLVISAGMLWIFGNFSLLRSRPEVQE